MKKLLCMISVLAMLTCAVSCGDEEDESSRKKSSKSSVSDSDEPEEETTKRERKKKAPEEESEPETEEETEEETTEPETKPVPKTNNWQDVYSSVLYAQSSDDTSMMFSIQDIDGDGTPELIESPETGQGKKCAVYTCESNDLVIVGSVGDYGTVNYEPASHSLVETKYDEVKKAYVTSVKRIENGSVETIMTAEYCYDEEWNPSEWRVDGYEVTEEEYDTATYPYYTWCILGRDFGLTDLEIEAAVYGADDWKQLYSDFLIKTVEEHYDDPESQAFSLYDITGDGIPELFISQGYYHAAGVDIYSLSDRLYHIGSYGSYGGVTYYVEPEVLFVSDMHMGYETGSSFEVLDGRLARTFSYYNNCGAAEDESQWEFEVNGKKVTQDEFNKALEDNSTEHYVWLGNDNELTEETALAVADGEYNESAVGEYNWQ